MALVYIPVIHIERSHEFITDIITIFFGFTTVVWGEYITGAHFS